VSVTAAPASAKYWRNANNRRNWCSAVRWGHSWIERHPHWQKVCAPIEKFRPVGWWSNMCHTIYSAGSWGRWYRSNPWWRRQCKRIRNPQFQKGGAVWRWNPKHRRHQFASWCEKNGAKMRHLNNRHYNHWCHGREAKKGQKRGLWDVDMTASQKEQSNFWFCRSFRKRDAAWKKSAVDAGFQKRCSKGEGARGARSDKPRWSAMPFQICSCHRPSGRIVSFQSNVETITSRFKEKQENSTRIHDQRGLVLARPSGSKVVAEPALLEKLTLRSRPVRDASSKTSTVLETQRIRTDAPEKKEQDSSRLIKCKTSVSF